LAIQLVRIDDRLIHGQVTTAWLRLFPSDTIIIANDRIAKDPTYAMIFSVAKVPGAKIFLLGTQEAADFLLGKGAERKVFLITPSPEDVVALMDAGVEINKINIGGLQMRPGAKSLARVVYAQPQEEAAFRELDARGVEMEVRMVPTDRIARLNL